MHKDIQHFNKNATISVAALDDITTFSGTIKMPQSTLRQLE
jgi:hypothetical protein